MNISDQIKVMQKKNSRTIVPRLALPTEANTHVPYKTHTYHSYRFMVPRERSHLVTVAEMNIN